MSNDKIVNIGAPQAAIDHLSNKPKAKTFPLVELFGPTIEGEGKLIGTQTFFLRFGLCDFKCKMCDSMHAVDPQLVKAGAQRVTAQEIADVLEHYRIKQAAQHVRNVTFSGGNPCIHDLSELVDILKTRGWKIFVETQGTKQPNWLLNVDEIVVSPKSPGMGEEFDPQVFLKFFSRYAHAGVSISVKIVIFSAIDIEMAAHVGIMIQNWIREWRYIGNFDLHRDFFLSLGNDQPPKFVVQESGIDEDLVVRQLDENQVVDNEKTLAGNLLNRYNILCEEIMKDARLGYAKFLPQLHVLVYGNQTGK